MYTLTDKDGNKSLLFEELLSKLERRFAQVIRDTVTRHVVPKGDDRGVLAEFAATLMVRLPAQHRRWAKFQERLTRQFLEMQRQMYNRHPEQWEKNKAELRKQGLDIPDHWTPDDVFAPRNMTMHVEIPKAAVLLPAFENIPKLAEMIYDMSWIFYHTNDLEPFCTSDWPLALLNRDEEHPGLAQPNVELTWPLTRTDALWAHWRGVDLGFRKATRATVKAINLRSCMYSEEMAIASKTRFPGAKAVVKRLQSYDPSIPDDDD
jgi:hypothetical protein